jgi:hypothetical protein
MRIRRDINSIPVRSAAETWDVIMGLVTGSGSIDVEQLRKAGSTIGSVITDELPAERPFILEGCGPQLRIYCRFASKAMEGDDAVDPLTWNPTAGDWTLHVPCDAENLSWVQSALKASAPRIKVFDIAEADRFEEDAAAKPSSKHTAGEIVVDWNVKD